MTTIIKQYCTSMLNNMLQARVRVFMMMLACMVCFAAFADEESESAGSDPLADMGEETVFNDAYFSKITYEWEDENGAIRISNLTEPATELPQIIAFIREVYTNPLVPGFVKDKAWETQQLKFDEETRESNKYVTVPYAPVLAENSPYGITGEVPVPIEGCTAMIVEVDDDYAGAGSCTIHDEASCENYLSHIKRITLLTKQRYVSEEVSTDNPGYLFNYVGALNRFFIITKGNNRINKDYPEGTAPFYNMFEEFSPSNEHPIYGAFDVMNGNQGFQVDHNCGSVMNMNHTIVMSPEEGEMRDYAVNFMFLLPDYRFACDSRQKPNSSSTYEWYTYYSQEHTPYFFFNQLTAKINERPKVIPETVGTDERMVEVKLEWNSTYNDIVGYRANEDFYIYRVVHDFIESDPLPADAYRVGMDEADYTQNEDGSITSRRANNTIYIKEPQYKHSYDVYYIVKGRRYLTDFELTESNIVEANIPGYTQPGTNVINLVVDGERKSVHDIKARTNTYTHTVYMVNHEWNEGVNLNDEHIRATNEATVKEGTKFRLMRYAGKNDVTTEPELVQTLEVKDMVYQAQYDQYLYYGVLTDADGNVIPGAPSPQHTEEYGGIPGNYMRFKTVPEAEGSKKYVTAALDQCKFELNGTAGHFLINFTDQFAVQTDEGAHPDRYYYYIDYVPPVFVDADEVHKELTDNGDQDSNLLDFLVPHNTLKVGYIPYSAEEILHDMTYSRRLQSTSPAVQFSVTNNPNVTIYTLYKVPSDGAEVNLTRDALVRVTRMPSGRLYAEVREDATSTQLNYATSLYPATGVDPAVKAPYGLKTGESYVLVTRFSNGNSYGNVVRTLEAIPTPAVQITKIRSQGTQDPETGLYHYKAYSTWSADYSESSSFVHHGYRAWHRNYKDEKDRRKEHTIIYQDNVFDMDEQGDAPMYAAARYVDSDDAMIVNHEETFMAHKASVDEPLNYRTHVRLYAALPEEMTISQSLEPATGYTVTDHSFDKTELDYDDIMTGIDAIEADTDFDPTAPAEYFNLQGLRIVDPSPGDIVIRRQGSHVSKILIK